MKLKNLLVASLMMLCTWSMQAAKSGLHTFAASSKLASGDWVKISLNAGANGMTEDGVYQITYEQLSKMGFSNPSQVAVYGFGGHEMEEAVNNITDDDLPEVAVYHDSEGKRILFYAQGLVAWKYHSQKGFYHRQNTYDNKAYYFLHQKEEETPVRMDTLIANENASENVVSQYDVHFLHEQNLVNLGETGREKFGESFVTTKIQKFNFEQVAAGTVRLTTNFVASATDMTSLTMALNGQTAGNISISRKNNEYAFANETTLDKSVELEAPDGLTVTLTYATPSGVTASVARLNYIRVQAKRDFAKPSSFETFRTAKSSSARLKYQLGNAVDEEVQIWDVTSPNQAKVQLVSEDHTFCPNSGGIHEYVMVNLKGSDFPGVTSEGRIANQNLHGLPMTNMVIITAPAYYGDACRLADYRRQNDGLHVTVLTPEQIYNEFSSGAQDATAFRMLMKMFYDRYTLSTDKQMTDSLGENSRRELRYLLLWGDGYYDNQAIDRQYYLPSYETDASLVETSSCVCDDYYGFLDDGEGGLLDSNLRYNIARDGLDIGIGRLPVCTLEQSAGALNKILNYCNNSYFGTWKNKLCFLSDDDKTGDSYNCHVRHNDQLVDNLVAANHNEFMFQKIYLPAYKQTESASGTDYPDAKKEFNETLKQGVLMVNYAGHGNTTAITNENMMNITTAQQLNMKHLPLWVTASCDVSRWDADATSMGECLFLNPNGGAIAMLSTVRVVYAQQNLSLNTAIIDNIFNRFADGTRYRLGDVLRASKVELGADYNKLNFCLLGDPSLTLAFPEQKVRLTEINGVPVDMTAPLTELKTMSNVTIKGEVLHLGSETEVDTTFNGLVYPTFFDGVDTLTADKGAIQADAPVYTFTTRTKKAFAGRGEVRNGKFEFSFTVPIDISYCGNPGLANFYACSDDGAEASGYYDHYVLTGSDDYEVTDTIGPVITELFLNSRDWSDGGVVNATPYFYAEVQDESGFNATGNTIGHDIVLTIRCTSNLLLASEQHTLNDYFTTFTGDPTRGNVQYSLPELEDGTYEATFRIWDVYNNPSTRKFTFTVQTQKAPEAVVVQAYPCPARTGDTITFRVLHNRPESAQEMTLQVYTQTGYKVYETTLSASSASKVYVYDMEHPTELNNAINADESGDFMGSAIIEWNTAALRPGFYLYRVFLSSNGSTEMSTSKLLMVNP